MGGGARGADVVHKSAAREQHIPGCKTRAQMPIQIWTPIYTSGIIWIQGFGSDAMQWKGPALLRDQCRYSLSLKLAQLSSVQTMAGNRTGHADSSAKWQLPEVSCSHTSPPLPFPPSQDQLWGAGKQRQPSLTQPKGGVTVILPGENHFFRCFFSFNLKTAETKTFL